ncbi:GntR family transcriptional regulator [Nocardia arthritidis]|uniref:GntR family transcriptional regulator n=1 Tax=Nocardia arthritidis TaxID=228602 RepID=A0A6G9YBX7_9NOCA|nr:GntR family transcriptional regulator [Nocardia arthritidis]QIS10640.1 GntR family transcriptional regulator [Nocardia arthritidis]
MAEPAYVTIAGNYARRIRSGALPPGTQLPSYAELAAQNHVSEIVVRKALELLQSQGLVRSQRRRGIFVADRPNLVRVAPERQMEDPEVTYSHESDKAVTVEREVERVAATEELAEAFGIAPGEELTHVITRAAEDSRPVSVSDSYQPTNISDTSGAVILEETVADRLPTPIHADWLGTPPGDLVKTVHQRFLAADGGLVMLSDVSYPRDRYDAMLFRMTLSTGGTAAIGD